MRKHRLLAPDPPPPPNMPLPARRPLSPDLRRRVARRWGLLAAEFGYRISAGEGDAAADAVAARGEAAAV